MPIVRQPLANRLYDAAKTSFGLAQGMDQAKAGKALLEKQGMGDYAPFVNPLTGELGGVGKNMFDLYGAMQKYQASNMAGLQRQMMMANYQNDLEERRFKRKSVQEILNDMEDEVTLGKNSKIKSIKPGILQQRFGLDPATVSERDKRELAERIYQGQSIDRNQITPGQLYEPPVELPFGFQFGGKEYRETDFGF